MKPANLGSSVGMTKAHDRAELAPALELAAAYDRKVIIEAACDGRELECSLLGNDEPQASVAGEVMPANEFYDYEAKYTEGKMAFVIPADVGPGRRPRRRPWPSPPSRPSTQPGFARCDFFLEKRQRARAAQRDQHHPRHDRDERVPPSVGGVGCGRAAARGAHRAAGTGAARRTQPAAHPALTAGLGFVSPYSRC